MRTRSPSYLTKNRLGIFIFQYRFPKAVQEILTPPKILFRRTLKTRDKRLAEQRARKWWVILDELERKYFDTPKMYAKAIELMSEYKALDNLSWGEAEVYLSELDEDESVLLTKAIHLEAEKKLIEDNLRLQQTLEILKTNSYLALNTIPTPTKPINTANNLLLTEAIDLFISYKNGHVQKSTTKNLEGRIRFFGRILLEHTKTELRITDLTPQLIKHYRTVLPQLPAIRNGKLSNASVNALVRDNTKKISATTVRQTFVVVGEFLDWLVKEIYPVESGLRTILSGWKAPKDSKSKERLPYDEELLKKIFESKAYTKGPIKTPSMYWVPLLALFTGARAGELIQLEFSDIQKADDVYFININDDDEKSIKTKAGIRTVPIHSKLIELGFLDFIKERQKTSATRLFPEETRNDKGQFDSFSKRFATFKKNCGIESTDSKMYDFHSFRHTVRTALTQARIDETLIDEIIGHTSQNVSIGRTNYNHADLIVDKAKAIESLNYNIDFSRIKPWNKNPLLQVVRNRELKRGIR